MPDANEPEQNPQGKLLDEVFKEFAEFSKPFEDAKNSSSSTQNKLEGGLDEQDLNDLRNLTKLILSDSKETEKQIFGGVLGNEEGSITKMVGKWLEQYPPLSLKEPIEGLLEGLQKWEKTRTVPSGDSELANVRKLIRAFSDLLYWVNKIATDTKADQADPELQSILTRLENCDEPPTEATDAMLFNYLEALIGDDSDAGDENKIPEADYEGADQLIDEMLNPTR